MTVETQGLVERARLTEEAWNRPMRGATVRAGQELTMWSLTTQHVEALLNVQLAKALDTVVKWLEEETPDAMKLMPSDVWAWGYRQGLIYAKKFIQRDLEAAGLERPDAVE